MYFPTHWNQYRVMYLVHLRLIDRQSKKMLAEGFYKYLPEYNKNAPSYDDLVSNGAQGLKRELRRAAECSIDFFKKETFNLQK